jgi:hypothetical protein
MKLLLAILSVFFVISLYSQEDDIQKIREIYNRTSENIKVAKLPGDDGFGALYSNEIIVNSNDNSWRAVGNYLKKITFWYTDQPEFAQYQDNTETSVLTKIEIKTQSASTEYIYEFLFHNDQLVFYYEFVSNGEGEKQELRYYFKDEKLIEYREGEKVTECEDCAKTVLQMAEEYKQLFLKTFN